MTKEEKIEELRNDIDKFEFLKDLVKECEEYGIAPYEDIMSAVGYNTCDKCNRICDTELDLLWIDGFDWEDDNPDDQAILKALADEKCDYCAICWHCVEELKKKGKK